MAFRTRNSEGIAVVLAAVWCLLFVTPAQANIRFFTIVQQICKSYRVPATLDQMTFEDLNTPSPSFYLHLQSRRNNFEEVMLVGFIASGQAIARTGLSVRTINVSVTIPKADNMLLMTTADATLVAKLRLGEIKSSEFMRSLQWN